MNNRLKFKAFIKTTKELLKVQYINSVTRYVMCDREDGTQAFKSFDDVEPLQCIGFKDKNGKLIYEKDILLSPDNDEPYMVIVEWDNEKGYIVKAWNGKEFEYALSDDTLESLKYFQIIGNEFENPELLEGYNEHT